MRRAVVVLGGNAFVTPEKRLTMESQMNFAHHAMRQLRPLLSDEFRLLVSHGNGPQVGHILIRVEAALGKAYPIPLEVCVAESEGELGYVLELALRNVQTEFHLKRSVATVLTQVIEAVIDKDLTAALLADQLDAELLVILTDVPCAYENFGLPRQKPIRRISRREALKLTVQGHFTPGSMLPKIKAAINFADRSGRRTIICAPLSLESALCGRAGTVIESD